MSAKPASLLEAIQKATPADLEKIEQEIAVKQEEAKRCHSEIDRLKSLHKTIDILINGKPARKPREKKAKQAGSGVSRTPDTNPVSADDRRKRVAQYLAKHGATKPIEIADDLDIPHGSITFVLSTGAFAKTPNGIVLTPEGRQLYLEE